MKWLSKFFKSKPQHIKQKDTLVEHFSEDYLTRLNNEHKLITATVNRLLTARNAYISGNSPEMVDLATRNLLSRKVELEAQIDVLIDFLRG